MSFVAESLLFRYNSSGFTRYLVQLYSSNCIEYVCHSNRWRKRKKIACALALFKYIGSKSHVLDYTRLAWSAQSSTFYIMYCKRLERYGYEVRYVLIVFIPESQIREEWCFFNNARWDFYFSYTFTPRDIYQIQSPQLYVCNVTHTHFFMGKFV